MVIIRNSKKPNTISLQFDGYYEDENLPTNKHQGSGIYLVYAGEPFEQKSCIVKRILYIGESEDTANRPDKNHEHYKDWKKCLEKGEKLYFSLADVKPDEREQAENALIYHHRKILPINDKGKKSFDYPDTHIKITGTFKFLDENFVENRKIADTK